MLFVINEHGVNFFQFSFRNFCKLLLKMHNIYRNLPYKSLRRNVPSVKDGYRAASSECFGHTQDAHTQRLYCEIKCSCYRSMYHT